MQEQSHLARREERTSTRAERASGGAETHETDGITRLLLSLCTWPRLRNPIAAEALADAATQAAALALVRTHALTPVLYAAACEGALDCPLPHPDALRRAYFLRAARAALAIEELDECVGALRSEGCSCTVLKGAASMLSIYPDPALRVISDLDLLVPLAELDRCVDALRGIGYAKVDTATSREDEWLSVMFFDGITMYRDRSLPVELHCSFLGGLGSAELAAAEARDQAVVLRADGPGILGLRPEHAFITAACHLHRNFHRSLPYLKDVADMALLAGRIDDQDGWELVWDTCRRWEVLSEVSGVAAFINRYLPLHVPVCHATEPPFTADDLVYALQRLQGRGRLTEGLAARVRLMGRLPSWQARARLLTGMVFPRPGFLRWRYHIHDQRSLAPYYVRHIFRALTRTTQDGLLRLCQRHRRR